MFFNNKRKELYEQEKEMTNRAIESAKKWKELLETISKDYNKLVNKDLPEAIALIKKLQEKNNELTLKVGFYEKRLQGRKQ